MSRSQRTPRGRRKGDDVQTITTARRSHTDDINERFRKYTISMVIRTICVILAVAIDSPFRWVFAVGAVILPYIAVVLANAGRESTPPPLPTVTLAPDTRALTGTVHDPAPPGRDEPPEYRPGSQHGPAA